VLLLSYGMLPKPNCGHHLSGEVFAMLMLEMTLAWCRVLAEIIPSNDDVDILLYANLAMTNNLKTSLKCDC
jgi:hypothetical protein